MNFPIKNNVAQYIFEIPSTKEKVSFRPFLVGEHKTMMLALATEDIDNIVNAIKRIIEICSDGKVNSSKLAPFDIEYLFLQLRAKSIGESVSLTTNCYSCEQPFNFSIDVTEAKVDFTHLQENKIQISDSIGVMMRYPTLAETLKLNNNGLVTDDALEDIVIQCIVSVWDENELINTEDYPKEKIVEFVNTLTVDQLSKLTDFVLLIPSVRIIQTTTCPHCKEENKILIEGIENFFG